MENQISEAYGANETSKEIILIRPSRSLLSLDSDQQQKSQIRSASSDLENSEDSSYSIDDQILTV